MWKLIYRYIDWPDSNSYGPRVHPGILRFTGIYPISSRLGFDSRSTQNTWKERVDTGTLLYFFFLLLFGFEVSRPSPLYTSIVFVFRSKGTLQQLFTEKGYPSLQRPLHHLYTCHLLTLFQEPHLPSEGRLPFWVSTRESSLTFKCLTRVIWSKVGTVWTDYRVVIDGSLTLFDHLALCTLSNVSEGRMSGDTQKSHDQGVKTFDVSPEF